ncbi:MAG: B12-binding domain-containing radical SAM protein, partial [Thermoanaerobaculia bacterium]
MPTPRPRILLAHSYYLAHDAKQWRKMRPYPPLATLLVASVLRERGFEVELFDAMLAGGEAEFVHFLDASRASVVGI